MLSDRFKTVFIMSKIICGYWWEGLEERCGFLLQNLTEAPYKQPKNLQKKLQPFIHPPQRAGHAVGLPPTLPSLTVGSACEIQTWIHSICALSSGLIQPLSVEAAALAQVRQKQWRSWPITLKHSECVMYCDFRMHLLLHLDKTRCLLRSTSGLGIALHLTTRSNGLGPLDTAWVWEELLHTDILVLISNSLHLSFQIRSLSLFT